MNFMLTGSAFRASFFKQAGITEYFINTQPIKFSPSVNINVPDLSDIPSDYPHLVNLFIGCHITCFSVFSNCSYSTYSSIFFINDYRLDDASCPLKILDVWQIQHIFPHFVEIWKIFLKKYQKQVHFLFGELRNNPHRRQYLQHKIF